MCFRTIFFVAFALINIFFVVDGNASENWQRKHYVSIGVGAAITQGDLDGEKDSHASGSIKETIYAPNLGTYVLPELELGALINQHTIFLSGSYAAPATNFAKKNLWYVDETETQIYNLGLGYRYNFFWPDPFQISAGLSYSFAYLNTEKNAYLLKEGDLLRSDATMMGNGFALHGVLLYFLSNHFVMEMNVRFRTMVYSRLSTDNVSSSDWDSSFWQYSEEITVRFAYYF